MGVSVESYAADNGIDAADADREFGYYVSASTDDLPEIVESDGYMRTLDTRPIPWELDGRLRYEMAWRIEVEREKWAPYRGLDVRGPLRPDLGEAIAWSLFHLGSLCETDVVLRAQWATGRGLMEKTWRPEDRRRG